MKFTVDQISSSIRSLFPAEDRIHLLERLIRESYKKKECVWFNICNRIMVTYTEKTARKHVRKCYYTYRNHFQDVAECLLEIDNKKFSRSKKEEGGKIGHLSKKKIKKIALELLKRIKNKDKK